VSGNNQTARAGDTALGQPVVGKLVRLPNGQVTWVPERIQRFGSGVLDLLVPRSFAQGDGGTVVNGSPIPGAVVCAVSVTQNGLTPFTPCTNTDANGRAVFYFTPGTRAGEQLAEIRGTVQNQPAVFDTARASVTAGPTDTVTLSAHSAMLILGGAFKVGALVTRSVDAYGNSTTPVVTLTASAPFTVSSDTVTAPNTEAEGTVHVRLDGTELDTVHVSSLINLRAHTYDFTQFCGWDGHPELMDGETSILVDSMMVTGVVDSVVAGANQDASRTRFWSTQTIHFYLKNGTTSDRALTGIPSKLFTQTPGKLDFSTSSASGPRYEATLTTGSPIRYDGGWGFCSGSPTTVRMTITER